VIHVIREEGWWDIGFGRVTRTDRGSATDPAPHDNRGICRAEMSGEDPVGGTPGGRDGIETFCDETVTKESKVLFAFPVNARQVNAVLGGTAGRRGIRRGGLHFFWGGRLDRMQGFDHGRTMSTVAIDLVEEIRELQRERNAVILAHNYQTDDIQELADYVGDSLGLSYQAAETDADVIAFCGVHFMGETAKILSPQKTVVIPDMNAGCSLSDSCPPEKLAAYLAEHAGKNYYVIAYINCSAGVKALADVICTSGNAVKIVAAAPPDRNILFVPDQNLGAWVMEQTGRPMDLWQGNCYVHVEFTRDSISRIRMQYPEAKVVAHPECTFAVRMLADEVCSTEKMIGYCRSNPAREFIIVTESGMLHRLRREVPDKIFIPGPTELCSCGDCRYMKLNTLEKLRDCLADLQPEILIPEDIRRKAESSVRKMLALSR